MTGLLASVPDTDEHEWPCGCAGSTEIEPDGLGRILAQLAAEGRLESILLREDWQLAPWTDQGSDDRTPYCGVEGEHLLTLALHLDGLEVATVTLRTPWDRECGERSADRDDELDERQATAVTTCEDGGTTWPRCGEVLRRLVRRTCGWPTHPPMPQQGAGQWQVRSWGQIRRYRTELDARIAGAILGGTVHLHR